MTCGTQPLPSSVYDDIANPALATVPLPSGSWYLPGDAPLLIQRSNVTVDMSGCTLLVNPSDKANSQFDGISVRSVTRHDVTYQGGRFVYHVTGAITASTTKLTMSEVVDLKPGETVMIWAGVTPSDPVEVEAFIPATVASVKGKVITFTAPLGVAVKNYKSLDALTQATQPDEQWKVGAWGSVPSDANFSKGFGTDHGIERFIGGMVHDVTILNPTIKTDSMVGQAPDSMPNGSWLVSVIAAQNVTVNNLSVENPFASALHLWRAFNVSVDGYDITGAGLSKIWATNTAEATAVSIWGGRGATFSNVSIKATDVTMFNVEVGARDIWLNGANLDLEYTAARDYGSPSVVFGLFSTLSRTRCSNVTLNARTAGGSQHVYMVGDLEFDGAFVVPTWPTDYLSFDPASGFHFTGTVSLNGVTYGPAVSKTQTFKLKHGAGFRACAMPVGLFTAASFDVVSRGDLRDVSDNFGEEYWSDNGPDSKIPLALKWFRYDIGDTEMTQFLHKTLMCYLHNDGSTADGLLRVRFTYLPVAS